ncbi:BQ2448_7672 [Microbotryum intermedium]|uniref:Signal peptidase complex subunit 2 n=1 Tax=Microbotryum intermedium TaxID=269621 RepID=A0A238FRQ1_9BASI|nr:BQ2448_7672 [Microbotryum intermedium]
MANKKSKTSAPSTPSSGSHNKKDVAAAAAAAALTPKTSPKMTATSLPDLDDEKHALSNSSTNDPDPDPDHDKAAPAAPIKVNNNSLTELKLAVDDVVKEFFSRPSRFTASHLHEDVRLILGWSAVIVSAITGYYGYVVEFHQSKFWCAIGVTVYFFFGLVNSYAILSTLYWVYVNYVEKETIFQGKRRTFASRISTETLTLSSSARSLPQEPYNFPFSHFTSSPKTQMTPKETSSFPNYTLTLGYTHTSNNGKSLIRSFDKTLTRPLKEWFDTEGVLRRSALENELECLWKECLEG